MGNVVADNDKEIKGRGSRPAGSGAQKKIASVISGSASGAIVSLTLQPLDVLRTRLQVQATAESNIAAQSGVSVAQEIWQRTGIKGFWQGSGPTVWRLSVGLGLQFFTLETLRDGIFTYRRVGTSDAGARQLTSLEAFFCGGVARTVAAAATVPFTIVKTRMENTNPAPSLPVYKNTFAALQDIVQREGAVGLARGMGPTILTNAPFSALYYMFYTGIKKKLQPDGQASGAVVNFSAGTVAAVAATLLTQPTDMVRTQMQLGVPGNAKLGAIAILQGVVQRKGYSALLAGAGPRVLKRTFQTALVWTLYEELQPRLTQQAGRLRNYISSNS